ncbi:hypothetical protein PULV_a3749 [Pseudoalteromonas ulvae UL12]|uniref:GGDEF domain-containing phosphodiesterase n=1 Tax=Pseudoalteromonas ulvae TaxID=107327 RepID=UPI00186B88DD|nr:GGDEF domain-containing phosphodiesterase [Pseudoalteromonas ulvae]MBE0362063.1 hypothetical protein [Pseudoalteromonas ulvae UL12]
MDNIAIRLVYASVYLLTALIIFFQLKNRKDRNLLFVLACSFLALYWYVISFMLIVPIHSSYLPQFGRVIFHIGLFSFVWASLLRNYSPKWLKALAVLDLFIYFIDVLSLGPTLSFVYYVASSQLIIAISFFLRSAKRNSADIVLVFLFVLSAMMVTFRQPLEQLSPLINLSGVALINVSVCFALFGSSLLDYQQEISKLINSDTISNLPNRRALFKELKKRDGQGSSYHLLIVEWQGLKEITHDFGYSITDKTLGLLSKKTQQLTLPIQWYNLSLTQWVILFENNEDQVNIITEQVTLLVRQAFKIEQHEVRLKTLFGFAPASLTNSFSDKIQLAQLHLSQADKTNHINALFPVSNNLLSHSKQEQALEQKLKLAIQNEDISIAYQPKFSASNTELMVGCEALARWQSDGQWISPGIFIPLAERFNLISQIDLIVLKKAWQFAASLKREDFRVAVNFSSVNFNYEVDLFSIVKNLAERYQLPYQVLEIEITEAAMANSDYVVAQLTQLQSLGITVAIDDFGTGFSSLSQVNKLPFDTLKIDRAFIQALPDHNAIARFVLQLAQELKVNVVAEGVETHQQLDWLIAEHCDVIQGFLLSKPISEQALKELLFCK